MLSCMEHSFGQRLRELRKAKGLTQRELAQHLAIDFTYLSKLENDREGFQPSEKVIVALAEALDGDLEELMLLARKIPSAMRETIASNPNAQRFLRRAGELTEEEWRRILEIAEQERDSK